ncbi:MAG TPA: hypothetical protein VN285_07435 [Candidatus Deferrimicrobium sp.]|nr:hypothetical protein [Candidatus Deferrimicrobium sp.]
MFRHILSHCMVVALFMMATGTALAAPSECKIGFENIGPEMTAVQVWNCSPLTVTFSTTNPVKPFPYVGEYGDPGATGWWCNQKLENDVLIQYPQGEKCFLGWAACDPITFDMVVDFSPNVIVLEFRGDIFDMDDGTEEFIITAYNAYGSAVDQMKVIPSGPYGGDCGTQQWKVQGTGIRKVTFNGDKLTPNLGSGIDNLKVYYTIPYWDVQEELHNGTGETATNLEKWLEGDVKIKDWYRGSKFKSFSYGYDATEDETKLKWSNGTVADSQWTWACFKTNKPGQVVQKYLPRWTYASGDSVIAGPGLSLGFIHVTQNNGHLVISNTPQDGGPITIQTIDVGDVPAILSFAQLDYDSLSSVTWDVSLTDQHVPLYDSLVFTSLDFPSEGSIVFRARVILDDDPSNVVTYSGQYYVKSTDKIPTLTEWGMIIFCVLLFGWMAWVIVRRRRRVTIGM